MINEIRPKNSVFGLNNFVGRKTVFFFKGFDEVRNTFVVDFKAYFGNVFL